MPQGKLGARLRHLRNERRMSIRTLAARSGFSPSFISQLEADLVSPSIASLEKIAGQLDISLAHLFSSLESQPRRVVLASERVTYRSDWSNSMVEALNDAGYDRRLSAMQVTFETGGSTGKRLAPSWQDTICYIVAGTLQFALEDETYELKSGDTVYLQEGDTFMVHNLGPQTASLLLVSAASMSDIFPAKSEAEEDNNPSSTQ
jgi:transcriptional regulator with XRE-family HTH domain